MERVQLPLLPGTKGPGLTAVQEYAQDTVSIDLVYVVSFLLSHTLFVSPENMVAALPVHLSSLTSRDRVSEIVEVHKIMNNL